VNRGSAAQNYFDLSYEQNNNYVPLFPCDIATLVVMGELEDKNEIKLDFGSRRNGKSA